MTPEPGREALAAIVAGEPVKWQYRTRLTEKTASWTSWRDGTPNLFARSLDFIEVETRALYSAAQLAKVERERDIAKREAACMRETSIRNARERNAAEARVEAAEERVAVLEEALKIFADEADHYDPPEDDDNHPAWSNDFPIGALRRARNALKRETQNADQ